MWQNLLCYNVITVHILVLSPKGIFKVDVLLPAAVTMRIWYNYLKKAVLDWSLTTGVCDKDQTMTEYYLRRPVFGIHFLFLFHYTMCSF